MIYSDKKDNLTVSKDILYDLPPAPEKTPREVAFDLDSSQHLALKELLRNRYR